ncbi:hypothetical protein X777_10193 [Ooceraea biroi]|uniref:Uncharacterized protein n=1 Tax=Ooceraea biroi TaxID=2015173 RepID=A0A026X397_OOCBI|nr:hypothetical protein X777_10193 [Ooceraea biroi]
MQRLRNGGTPAWQVSAAQVRQASRRWWWRLFRSSVVTRKPAFADDGCETTPIPPSDASRSLDKTYGFCFPSPRTNRLFGVRRSVVVVGGGGRRSTVSRIVGIVVIAVAIAVLVVAIVSINPFPPRGITYRSGSGTGSSGGGGHHRYER